MSDKLTVAEQLVTRLREQHRHIAVAESLTGGLVAKKITDVPGASEVFECGICSYSNRIKHAVLGVSEATLSEYSEYSHACAREMAQGVRNLAGADIGVSTTGLAGPGGGTPEKPVGTVYVGVSTAHDTVCCRLQLDSSLSREEIREASAESALSLACQMLCKLTETKQETDSKLPKSSKKNTKKKK